MSKELTAAEFEKPHLDARLLLAHAANINSVKIFGYPEDTVDSHTVKNAYAMLKRRKRGEPVAYIVGKKEFWSISFFVTRDTLIPRPESEIIIETILNNIPDKTQNLSILDLGTGSGCLLLTLLSELPNARGIGVDISLKACAIAQQNTANMNLEKRAKIIHGDWMNQITEKFDIIVSNPPYIQDAEIETLDESVRDFEPKLALSGGYDGLVSYRKIIDHSRNHLNEKGFIAVEIGINQATKIAKIFTHFGFSVKQITHDLANFERCILATLQES